MVIFKIVKLFERSRVPEVEKERELAERWRVPTVSVEQYFPHSKAEAVSIVLGKQQKPGEKVWEAFTRL